MNSIYPTNLPGFVYYHDPTHVSYKKSSMAFQNKKNYGEIEPQKSYSLPGKSDTLHQNLECSKETMKKRILERKDIRNDKDINTIEKRISHFYEQTIPIIDEYTKKNLTIKISSEQDIEEVFKEAVNKLKTLIY